MQAGKEPLAVSVQARIEREHSPIGSALMPIFLGGMLTFGFYSLIPYLPFERELVLRYFCGHWIEYTTVAFFFWGMAILGLKFAALANERAALGMDFSGGPPTTGKIEAAQRAVAVEDSISTLPARLRHTQLVRRVQDVCDHVRTNRSSDNIEDHLKYLAEVAADRLHGSFSLVRTITWAIPILGFLGTVIGITVAISNVTPEQLDSSLSEVTGGLGVAFDTTALSLGLSMVLVFSSFVVESMEGRILTGVENYGIRRIIGWFPPASVNRRLLIEAESEAAHKMVEQTEELIGTHVELWKQSMEGLRQRWNTTLENHTNALNMALKQGTAGVLRDHLDQLTAVRNEFLKAFQTASKEITTGMAEARTAQREQQAALTGELQVFWERLREHGEQMQSLREGFINAFQSASKDFATGLAESRAIQRDEQANFKGELKSFWERVHEHTEQLSALRHEYLNAFQSASKQFTSGMADSRIAQREQQAALTKELHTVWDRIRDDISRLREDHAGRNEKLMQTVSKNVVAWQSQLKQSSDSANTQMTELKKQRDAMMKLVDGEQQLARLQSRLADNLEALRASDNFDTTLHNLSAAVHLLTATARPLQSSSHKLPLPDKTRNKKRKAA